ncbi:MAG TPA: hypothetical protein VGG46_15560 [Terriglobales bacterium]|jgi:hypothetical protein
MRIRTSIILIFLFLLSPLAFAKKKKKHTLPDAVLNARTVYVVVDSEAGEPVTNPTANRTALENVEKAISTWGRFRLSMESETADLVIAVRKGHAFGPTIQNSPTDNRPVIFQPSDGGIRIGGQQGRFPGTTDSGMPDDRGPHLGNSGGSADDSLAVYLGGVEDPLDSVPVWRDMEKNALNAPQVTAVEKFRKAIEEAEKQQKP